MKKSKKIIPKIKPIKTILGREIFFTGKDKQDNLILVKASIQTAFDKGDDYNLERFIQKITNCNANFTQSENRDMSEYTFGVSEIRFEWE